jgi:hypothetical protein
MGHTGPNPNIFAQVTFGVMSYFFLDDSKHPADGFVLAVFAAFSVDPAREVARGLELRGLRPYIDEFKSSHRMDSHQSFQNLRDDLRDILRTCKLGICVSVDEKRLPSQASELLEKMLGHPNFRDAHHEIITDQGIFSKKEARAEMKAIAGSERCKFHFEADSKTELGIQLADLAAHTCGIMMKDTLGLVSKTLPAGENSGYDPDSLIELGFTMWASLRYCFLGVSAPDLDWETDEVQTLCTIYTHDYGLVIDPNLSKDLRQAAYARFGSMYLGCIH